MTKPSAVEGGILVTEAGLPGLTFRAEYGETDDKRIKEISYDDALRLLNQSLSERDDIVWLALDRLDEAFVGYPDKEILALRALLRSYLDLLEFDHIKLKLFLRKDLFRKITKGGFVNLTHINAKKIEIVWDDEDIFTLLKRRIHDNKKFVHQLDLNPEGNDFFNHIFRDQVDPGERRPTTRNWMVSRISDANGAKPPRNLIDLMNKAKEEQIRKEQRSPRDLEEADVLIEPDSLKNALSRLSEERVNDTLLAEAPPAAAEAVEKFRNGKAEHNVESLNELDIQDDMISVLRDIGFIEKIGDSYKVPMLYRDGLNITQGKAFPSE